MTDSDSLIKARYAIAILRTAKASERHAAAKMVGALALEFPTAGTSDEIAEAHQAALVAFYNLAEALRTDISKAPHLWYLAEHAVQKWNDAF
jgi:hypothetical protein